MWWALVHFPIRIAAFGCRQVSSRALEAHLAGTISATAYTYLQGWASGTLRRVPRPAQYKFLTHNYSQADVPRPAVWHPARPRCNLVRVQGLGGEALPDASESEDEAEPGPWVIQDGP